MMPSVVADFFLQGDLGVAIFFVLSGFVIAHSLDGVRVTPYVLGWFVARRLARLHPPYVASIALVLGVTAISNLVLRDRLLPYPPAGWLAAHFFYLEDVLGIPKINDVYWTLCLEVQFYVLFVVLVGLAQRVRGGDDPAGRLLSFGVVSGYGLLVAANLGVPVPPGACFSHWHLFFGGAVVCWLARGRIALPAALGFAAALVALAWWRQDRMTVAALATMLVIYAGGRRASLVVWLNGETLQYLGKISYSLYLVHPLFGQRLANLLGRIAGASPAAAVLVFTGAIAGAIGGAHLFWRLVEVPAIGWSKRIRLQASTLKQPNHVRSL